MNRPLLKELLSQQDFLFTFELLPGRSVRTRQFQEIIKFLEKSQKENIFQIFTITDNAGGHPALSPIPLGRSIKEMGFEVIIHFSCKDKNRNQLESELLALDREGLHNLLVLTGDYPFYGHLGKAKPVFDLDSITLLQMISAMEEGIELPKGAPGGGVRLPAIPFFKGAVVNPFKLKIEELFWQYLKLYKKLKAGAYFIITQVGFYPKKWLELKLLFEGGISKTLASFIENEGLQEESVDLELQKIPLIGSVLYLTPQILKAILKGRIPGILLTESVFNKLNHSIHFEKEALKISAHFAAILKGLGYKGVHLCGFPLNYDSIYQFLEYFNQYSQNWENYLEEYCAKGVLESPKGLFKKEFPSLLNSKATTEIKGRISLSYLLNESIHLLFFNPRSPLYPSLKFIAKIIDQTSLPKRFLTSIEYFIKKLLFNCQECGDCTLFEFNYLCPQSGCAKYLLNGPCGGSIDGYCEVYPFLKKCHFVEAIAKSPSKGTLKKFFRPGKSFYLPPRNWELYKTSSWLNFYLQRDHRK